MTERDLNIAVSALRSEQDAYDMYTDMLEYVSDKNFKKTLRHIRKEEKQHIHMLERVLKDY